MKNKITFMLIVILCMITISTNPIQIKPQQLSQCQQKCKQNKQCIQQCNKQQQQFITTIITFSLLCILICVCLCGCCLLSTHQKFRKFRLLFDNNYKTLKNKYNKPNTSIISILQFNQHLSSITELLNYSHYKDNFTSKQINGKEKYQKVLIKTQQIQTFMHEIQVQGQDQQGDWSASGAIVCTNQGVICWFLKQYDQNYGRKIRNKVCKYVYISHPSNLTNVSGVWYEVNKKGQTGRKGEWYVKSLSQQLTNKDGQSNLSLAQ